MAYRHNNQALESRARIREVLIQKWDPIGVSGRCPADEYDSYIGTIEAMLQDERTNHQRIANHLLGLATNAMGLSDRPALKEKCVLAAAALMSLRAELTTRHKRRG
jgi:hypothetical protein